MKQPTLITALALPWLLAPVLTQAADTYASTVADLSAVRTTCPP